MTKKNDLGKRRAVCKACLGCLTVGTAGAIGYPMISFLGFPQRLAFGKPLEVSLDELPRGQAQYAQLRGRPIVVVVTEDGPRVLSASCTHLGCSVVWDAAESVFRCPCHGAIFDAGGEVLGGPVNAPLKKIPFEIEDGRLIVT